MTNTSADKAVSAIKFLVRTIIFCLIPGAALTLIHQIISLFGIEPLPSIYFAVTYIVPSFALLLVGSLSGECLARLPFRSFLFKGVLLVCSAYAIAAAANILLKAAGDYEFFQVAPAFVVAFVAFCLALTAFVRSLKGQYNGLERGFFTALLIVTIVAWLFLGPEEFFLPGFYFLPASALFLILLAGIAYRVITTTRKAGTATSWAAAVMVIFVAGGLLATGDNLELNEDFFQRTEAATTHPPRDAPNIILIVWDTVRRDHLSLYGYDRPTTPNLEKFAEEAVVYKKALAVSPWTLPSHASMFTGLYPRTHGAHYILLPVMTAESRDYRPLGDDFVTLAEKLAQNGYQCAGVSANFFAAGRAVNMQQGFQYFDDRVNPASMSMSKCEWCNRVMRNVLPVDWYFRHLKPTMLAGQVNRIALRWLASRDKNRPFFLFLNYMDTHGPYLPPNEIIHRFPSFQRKLAGETPLNIWIRTILENRNISSAEREHLTSQYDSELIYLNRQFNLFIKKMRKTGLYDNSIIIVTSDHGEFMGEHNLLGHGKALYSEVLEIPLVIKYPGSHPSGTNREIVENRELFHLLLNYTGIGSKPPGFRWDAVAELYPQFFQSSGHHWALDEMPHLKQAVYFGKYILISSTSGREEMYDLKEDPAESENLTESRQKTYSRGIQLLEKFKKTVPEFKKNQKTDKLSPEELRRLKALGYIK